MYVRMSLVPWFCISRDDYIEIDELVGWGRVTVDTTVSVRMWMPSCMLVAADRRTLLHYLPLPLHCFLCSICICILEDDEMG